MQPQVSTETTESLLNRMASLMSSRSRQSQAHVALQMFSETKREC